MMKNAEYWAERFAQIEDAQHQKAALIAANVYDAYERAKRELDNSIASWYARFAGNNGITLAEAKRLLAGKDLAEFKWDVGEYIKHGEENALDQRWMKELENASARVHISKYEALKVQIRQTMEELAAKYRGTMQEGMSDVYQSSFYHTAFEVQKGLGVGSEIAGVDQHLVEKVLSKPWAADGMNFSDRIWNNKEKLVDTLDKELTQGLILGKDPQMIINAVSDKMDVSKVQAGRLVMTESAYFGSEARKDCFNDLDVEQYVIVATLDSRTSEICQEMDGKVFKMSDYKVGLTAPPFHVNCRTTTAPYFADMEGIGDRTARDEKTGKTYTVPRDMKYGEWKKKYVTDNAKEIMLNQSEMQYYKPVRIDESTKKEIKRPETVVTARKLLGTNTEMWLSTKAKLKPKQLDFIEKNMTEAAKVVGVENISPVVIISQSEMGSNTIASYNAVSDMIFVVEEAGAKQKLLELQKGLARQNNVLSTPVHELLHKSDADWFRRKYGPINSKAMSNKYNETVTKKAKARIEKLTDAEYNRLIAESEYASKQIMKGKYDEAYIELRVMQLIR